MVSKNQNWSKEADVVIVGSGAAGLTAAILAHDCGAAVLIVERTDMVGGTTAVSGGGIWIPANHHMHDVGAVDSREEAIMYCKSLTMGRADDALIETFVDTAPEMIRYLEAFRYRDPRGLAVKAQGAQCLVISSDLAGSI
jgi:3-oxosteroid 1-dehydrogenase